MIHWRARLLVPRIPDGTLERDQELELRAHLARCARCRQQLREILLADELVRRIPPALVPIEDGPTAYARLHALSRWNPGDDLPHPEGWRLSLVALASVVLIYFIAATAGSWAPSVSASWVMGTTSSLPPDSTYVPGHYR